MFWWNININEMNRGSEKLFYFDCDVRHVEKFAHWWCPVGIYLQNTYKNRSVALTEHNSLLFIAWSHFDYIDLWCTLYVYIRCVSVCGMKWWWSSHMVHNMASDAIAYTQQWSKNKNNTRPNLTISSLICRVFTVWIILILYIMCGMVYWYWYEGRLNICLWHF